MDGGCKRYQTSRATKKHNKTEETSMKKRILSVFVSLCMMLTLLPATALAAETEEQITLMTPETQSDAQSMDGQDAVPGESELSESNTEGDFTSPDSTTEEITTAAALTEALKKAQQGDAVTLASDIAVAADFINGVEYTYAVFQVPEGVTLNGGNHTIYLDNESAAGTGATKHLIELRDGSALESITLDGKNSSLVKSGVQVVYATETGAKLNNVKIQDFTNAGLIINGSKATANGLTTSGNAWGAVNVDKGTTDPEGMAPSFSLTNGKLDEKTEIWIDESCENHTVNAAGFQTVTTPDGNTHVTSDPAKLGEASITANGKTTVYSTLEAAVTAVQADQTIDLLKDVELEGSIEITASGVTLNGKNHKITYAGNGTAENPANALIIARAQQVDKDGRVTPGADRFTMKDAVVVPGTTCKYGIQLYCVTGSKLDNITVEGGAYGSVLVNGAEAEISDTKVDSCIEYAVGTYVKELPQIKLDNVTGEVGEPLIKVDAGTITNIKNQVPGMSGFDISKIVEKINEKLTGTEIVVGENGEILNPVKTFNITFDANGGTIQGSSSAVTNNDGKLTSLPTASRSGDYQFAGWYTNLNGGIQITVDTVFSSNTTLYAHWHYTGGGSGTGGGTGGSSGSGSSGESVTVDRTTGGTVQVRPGRAESGETVTIIATPKDGYEVGEVTVTDRNGKEIDVRSAGDNRYTFTMPSTKVDVKVDFVRVGGQQPATPSFRDVSNSAYYADAVRWAMEQGITTGTTADTFSPNSGCTRAQIVTFLWRANGSPAPSSAENPFTDVNAGAYYADAVLWAVEQGITGGTTATTFSPDSGCTRAQAATFLWRASGSPAAGESGFADVADGAYYADAVNWAVANGVTQGTAAGTFSPNTACTRAQIVTFLYRAMA